MNFLKKIQINQNQNEIQKSTITFGMLKIKINSTFLKNENIKRWSIKSNPYH